MSEKMIGHEISEAVKLAVVIRSVFASTLLLFTIVVLVLTCDIISFNIALALDVVAIMLFVNFLIENENLNGAELTYYVAEAMKNRYGKSLRYWMVRNILDHYRTANRDKNKREIIEYAYNHIGKVHY